MHCLANFIEAASKEDKQFMVFPYNLSHYKQVNDLPGSITNIESLPEEVDEWLQYFLQAKPRAKGRNVYMAVLIGLSMPFITFIKKISPWCKEKKFGMWESSLQSEKLSLSGLASTFHKYNGYPSIESKVSWSIFKTFQLGYAER